jgi:hypothetical protein
MYLKYQVCNTGRHLAVVGELLEQEADPDLTFGARKM